MTIAYNPYPRYDLMAEFMHGSRMKDYKNMYITSPKAKKTKYPAKSTQSQGKNIGCFLFNKLGYRIQKAMEEAKVSQHERKSWEKQN